MYVGGWYSLSSDNTVLAEFLASHGYVVATTPHLDRGLWEYDFSMEADTLSTRRSDIQVVLKAMGRSAEVDASRIAVGGYSAGGIVALQAAARDERVDAVFGLDPTYLYEGRKGILLPAEVVRVPVLTLHAGHPDRVSRARHDVLDSLTNAARTTVPVPDATHGDFSDDVVIEAAFGLVGNPLRPTAAGWAAYRASTRHLLDFLDSTLE